MEQFKIDPEWNAWLEMMLRHGRFIDLWDGCLCDTIELIKKHYWHQGIMRDYEAEEYNRLCHLSAFKASFEEMRIWVMEVMYRRPATSDQGQSPEVGKK